MSAHIAVALCKEQVALRLCVAVWEHIIVLTKTQHRTLVGIMRCIPLVMLTSWELKTEFHLAIIAMKFQQFKRLKHIIQMPMAVQIVIPKRIRVNPSAEK